jgi:hypothetical protein
MVKDIVIVADLGAAGNLVKNILLLSEEIHWPMPADRYDTIIAQYPTTLKFSDWLETEYQLRFWNKYYGVDISDDINIDKFNQRHRCDKSVVYLNHSAFYQKNELNSIEKDIEILYVAPVTEFGLLWQIRSYCEKKTVEKLHNFTFDSDIVRQKQIYCNEYGEESYYRLNVQNFKSIVNQRQQEFGKPDITLEQLLLNFTEDTVLTLSKRFNITIDINKAKTVIQLWRNLHWPLNQTKNWKYYD